MVVYVGGYNLGLSTLGLGGPGGFRTSSSCFVSTCGSSWNSLVSTRGQANYGPWGGSLAFNNTTNWFFDQTPTTANDIPAQSSDFLSVAVHEIGHLLGIGSSFWDSLVSTVAGNSFFNGARSVAQNGGNSVRLNAEGDHWADGTNSTMDGAGSFETAFDPTILVGTRKLPTDLDWAALLDMGWAFSAAIEPPPVIVPPPVVPPPVVPPPVVPPPAVPPPTITPPTITPPTGVPVPSSLLLLALGVVSLLIVGKRRI